MWSKLLAGTFFINSSFSLLTFLARRSLADETTGFCIQIREEKLEEIKNLLTVFEKQFRACTHTYASKLKVQHRE